MKQFFLIASVLFASSALAFPTYSCYVPKDQTEQRKALGYTVTKIDIEFEQVLVQTSRGLVRIPAPNARLGTVKGSDNELENYFLAGMAYDLEWLKLPEPVKRGLYDNVPYILTLEQDINYEGECYTFLESSR